MNFGFLTEKAEQSLRVNDVSNTCMMCFKECETREVVYTGDDESQDGFEVWVYCQDCKIDTFHQIPKI